MPGKRSSLKNTKKKKKKVKAISPVSSPDTTDIEPSSPHITNTSKESDVALKKKYLSDIKQLKSTSVK